MLYIEEDINKSTSMAHRLASLKRRRFGGLPGHDENGNKIEKSMTRRANYTVALKDSLANNAYVAGYDAEIASIAVMNGDLLLMGKRRDNGKWTLPGGHLNPGESPHDGGLRELYEEAGIQAHALTTLGQRGVLTDTGKFMMIHAYYLPVDAKVTTKLDPDEEMAEWRWFNTKNGLPKYVMENMHVKRNFVLNCLGLQKSEDADALFYVDVIMKAAGSPRADHKYLRRYKAPNGKWVYVYHEPGQHGRAVPEEAINRIKELAEEGDEHAQHLLMTLEDHDKDKLNTLRELGDQGDDEAIHHLKTLGIDHADDKEKRQAAQIERDLLAERNNNPLVKPLEGPELLDLHDEIKRAVDQSVFTYLRGHVGSNPERTLREAGVTLDTVMRPVLKEKTVIGALTKLHESLKAVERAHAGVQSSNQAAASVGGYANHAWNTTLSALKDQHIIPTSMHLEQRAGVDGRANRQIESLDPVRHAAEARDLGTRRREAAERVARERQERQAREAREATERQEREARQAREEAERAERERVENAEALGVHQQSVNDMISYFGMSVPASEHPNIAKNMQKWWGSDFKFNNFVKHLNPGRDEKTELKIGQGFLNAMRARTAPGRRAEFSITFDVIEKRTGRQITSAHRSVYKNEDGSIHWSNGSFSRASNENMKKFPGMGRGLYKGVEGFLKEITAGWTGAAKENTKVTIGTCANSGFRDGYKGALVWAKHCFDWAGGESYASSWKRTWNSHIDRYAGRINMPAGQVRELKAKIAEADYPHQFVNTGFVITKDQAKAMVGHNLDFDFDQIFEKKGYCDIGDLIMIDSGTSWSAENYLNRTTGRAGALNTVRTAYYAGTTPPSASTRVESGPAPAAPAPAARGTTVSREGPMTTARSMSREDLIANGWTISGEGEAQVAHIGPLATADATIRRINSTTFAVVTGFSASARSEHPTLISAVQAANSRLGRSSASLATTSASAPSGPASSGSGIADNWLRRWPRVNARGQSRITITPQRLARIVAQPDEVVGAFLRATHSLITPAARKRIRAALRELGRSPT